MFHGKAILKRINLNIMNQKQAVDIKKAWIPLKKMTKVCNQSDCIIEDDCFIKKKEFVGCSFSDYITESTELEQIVFEKCTFDNIQMLSFLFKNIRFNNCRTINTNFKNSKIIRTEFNGSKLLGISFESCIGTDITFSKCNCQFADFRETKFKRTVFEDCILRESDFQGADLSGVIFRNCDLREAQFSFTVLNGTHFCSSRIEGIKIQAESLHGAIVDYHQAAYFGSKLLGLKIQ